MINENDVLAPFKRHVKGLKSYGNDQYTGLCPFHDGHNPSFSLNKEGLWKCHAGCGEGNAEQFQLRVYKFHNHRKGRGA